MKNKLKL